MKGASQLPGIPSVPYNIARFAQHTLGYAHALDCRWEEIPSVRAPILEVMPPWCVLCGSPEIPVIQHRFSGRCDLFLGQCRRCRAMHWAIRIYLKKE